MSSTECPASARTSVVNEVGKVPGSSYDAMVRWCHRATPGSSARWAREHWRATTTRWLPGLVFLVACRAQEPPANVPGFDPSRFSATHPDNAAVARANLPRPRLSVISGAADNTPPQRSLEILHAPPKNAVVFTSFDTATGVIEAGVGFACTTPSEPRPLLCTTFSVFAGQFAASTPLPRERLQERVRGGFARGRDADTVFARMGPPLVLPGTGATTPGDVRDDFAVFPLAAPTRIHALSLQSDPPVAGDRVFILAPERTEPATDTAPASRESPEIVVRNIPAVVVDGDDAILMYAFDGTPPRSHIRGAPVLDTSGAVVGIHREVIFVDGEPIGGAAPIQALRAALATRSK